MVEKTLSTAVEEAGQTEESKSEQIDLNEAAKTMTKN